jgi:MFS family permease
MRRYSVKELVHKYFYTGLHRDGIRSIFWGVALRKFAATTVGLFVPIYVYTIGYSSLGGSVIGGIRILLLYLIVARLSIFSTSLLVERIIDSIGFRWTLLLSSIFLFIKFVLLNFAESDLLFLWLAAVVSGIVTTTYWVTRHSLFGEDQDITSIGSSLGFIVVLTRMMTIIGPMVGAFITVFFGFSWLFNLGLVLALLSAIPYFFMHHHHRHHPDGLSGLLEKIRDPDNFPLMISWIGRSWDDTLTIDFWPLYIFLAVGGIGQLGIISSLVAIVAMIVAYITGRMFDRTSKRKRMYLAGASFSALLWPVKAFARAFWSIFGIDSLHSVVSSFYTIPFLSQTYRFSFRRDTVAFFVFREIVWSIGVAVFLLLAFLITFSWSWTLLFLLGGIGVVISMNLVSYKGFR